nr:gem-associated protein 5-like [Megalopta genalis]XP_033335077.1 gem-associated protein 5-like [Megalopta genalis]XP_033335078.1 gem-associated protein 5-like [Megalopta genalis]XP_033335079.1 gem-associated protein 5-like [Megalopta genalis]XP_033335080.1 gem-associated protein 5-like [Megalopta genalis]
MNEITLPPSPNWYLSHILACSYNGTVAWGARNTITILKLNENEKALNYFIIRNAHKVRVTSLAFTPQFKEVNGNLLASTGDDDKVKVWDAETLAMVYSYSFGADKTVVGTDWSYKAPNVLYAASSDGCILSWNVYFNIISSISLGKVTPTCLSSCPHHPRLVAVGSKRGLIYIVNFEGKGTVTYKLRGHDTEIVSLSWCPSEENVINGKHSKDLLLASGGKDRSIYIWRAGGDGRYEMTISLPVNPIVPCQHRSKLSSGVGNWITVHWIEPKLLLTSSSWSELISWDFSTMTKGKPNRKLVHAHHKRGLFCIAHVPDLQEDLPEDWRIRKRYKIWTLAQDRRLICCAIEENNVEIEYDVYTQSGYVYCIASCPIETSRIAFGVGDATIRLWNLSETHTNTFDITILWQKIMGKIRTISWHPERENLLAYATEEGRIGVFDTNSNKPPTLYRQYHRKIVYAIHWGPYPETEQYALYSCAEGECVYYDPELPNEEPKSIFKKDCTEFSWKPDFSCLAVGFENGSISFLNQELEERGYAKSPPTAIVHCLVWHPESTATDSTYSPMRNYLAVAYKSCTIIIFDLSNLMNHLTKPEDPPENGGERKCDPYKVNEVVASLTGHVHSVVCLAWNPFISGQLVSGSYDSTAQVWNVETQELIATYKGHSGPVLCCMWSPLSPDYIITGSFDFTVRIWKITNNKPIVPQETIQKNPVKKDKKKQAKVNEITDASVANGVPELTNTISECSISNVPQFTQKSKTLMLKDERKKKTEKTPYFVKSTKTMNDKTHLLKSLINIVKSEIHEDVNLEENHHDILYHMTPLIFSSKDNFMSFFTSDKCAHAEEGRHTIVTEMDVWCDNLKQNLDNAAKENRLTDFLVSLSVSLSMKTWKEMCELYAYQLISEGNPCKAVSYLLCIHKTSEAIETLLNANLHREAYALARCKLEPDDPTLTDILQKWAKYSVHTGRFEEAAYIFAKLRNFTDVIKYLALRKDASTLITAAEIALLRYDDILSKSLTEEAINLALGKSEYNLVRDIITKFPYFKYREVHLLVFEELQKTVERSIKLGTLRMWLNGKLDDDILQSLEIICKNYYCCYNDLRQSNSCYSVDDEQMLWLTISYEIALAMISTEKEQKLKHVATALGAITQFETLHRKNIENQCNFLLEVIIKLDARSPTNTESIFSKTDYPVSISLRAYLCQAMLNWFINNIETEVIDADMRVYIVLIEDLFEDALNKQIIKYWLIQNEIKKLESQVVSALGKTQEDGTSDENTELLVQKLNALKAEKRQLVEALVCVPNPVMVYSNANELGSKLLDDTLKSRYLEIVSATWKKATSEIGNFI